MHQVEGDINPTVTADVQVTEPVVDTSATNESQPGLPPAEEAAMKFTQLLPYVKKLALAVDGKRSLVRVLHALAEFPLGPGKPRLLNEKERTLFHLLQELQGHKSVVLQNFMEDSLKKEKALAEAGKENTNVAEEI